MSNKPTRPKRAERTVHPKLASFDCHLDPDTVSVENNGRMYEWCIDCSDFTPEEIKVKISKTKVQIDGLHETELETNEMTEEVILPEEVQSATIDVSINSKGILRIQAPYEPQAINTTTKVVSSTSTTQVIETETSSEASYRHEQEERSSEVSVIEPQVLDTDPVVDERYVDASKAIVKKN
jgi:HSP20 family molecular chaperone IbpA